MFDYAWREGYLLLIGFVIMVASTTYPAFTIMLRNHRERKREAKKQKTMADYYR